MFNNQKHGFCSEFYTVKKTIEVVVPIQGADERIRIDALEDGQTGKFSTKAYIEESLTIQPTYPQSNGAFSRKPQDYRIWVDYNLPWTNRDTVDDALNQALGFLKEKCSP
ncbi:hypothetical protein [Rheinheimera nanhaiensis]|uniref:hypothetical protein n=1 Tax=Rheinheimera nanhaiensis TaxID=1163621 RepID=UPI00058E9D9C|nr:hypothetical protein [Rheinheimera nanhaiensis]